MDEIKTLFALFRYELFGLKLCDEIKNSITDEMLLSLYKISKKHDLAHLIADALDRNGLWTENNEIKSRFLKERNMAVFRCEQLRFECEQICDCLETAKIEFLPLKGTILRDYYPQFWMRTSCDIDVLVRECDLEKTILVLQKELGYTLGERGGHDVHLFAASGVHLELHFSLVENENKWEEALESIWENTISLSEYKRGLTSEIFYLYHIVHMAVHMRIGGCGVKPLLDIWIIKKNWEFNRPVVETMLESCGLLTFEQKINKLANVWLENEKMDDISAALQSYILYGGVYGNTQNRVAVQQVKKGGKVSYLSSRIFISFDELATKYPTLKKQKWLFPFFQLYRWIDLLFHKEKRDKAMNTVKQTYATTEGKLSKTEELFDEIGI